MVDWRQEIVCTAQTGDLVEYVDSLDSVDSVDSVDSADSSTNELNVVHMKFLARFPKRVGSKELDTVM